VAQTRPRSSCAIFADELKKAALAREFSISRETLYQYLNA